MYALAVVLVLVGAWEAAVQGGVVDPLIVPAPSDVATALFDDRADLTARALKGLGV